MIGMTSVRALVRAMRDARWSELRDVIEAQRALVLAQLTLMIEPRGTFSVAADSAVSAPPPDEQRVLAERLARAVVRAARYGIFRPRCLARAIALSRMLSAHGIEGHTIRIGVSRENGSFVAHAWVERGTSVLGDTVTHTRSFAPLTNVRIGNEFFA